LEPGLTDHLREHRRALQLLVRQVLLLERLLEGLAALLLRLLTRLARVPLPDLVARAGRRGEREPVAGRPPARLRGEELDEGSAPQAVVQRHDAAVDLRPDRAVADVGVDRVREVDRRRPCRGRLNLALRRKHLKLAAETAGG